MSIHDRISSETLKRAYTYVLSTRHASGPPSRSGIDPLDMAEWLDHTELLEVVNHGESFRYRIAGGQIERIFNAPMHGRMLEEVFSGDVLSSKLHIFRRSVENRSVILSNDTLERGGKSLRKYERVLIPLSENGLDVDILFGCIYPMYSTNGRISMLDPDLKIIAEEFFEDPFGYTMDPVPVRGLCESG